MQEQVLEILNVEAMPTKCQLCAQSSVRLREFDCIEQKLQICLPCSKKIKKSMGKIHGYNKYSMELYSKVIHFDYIQPDSFYKLQYKQCEICYRNKICSKICHNDHFFCFSCSKSCILEQLDKKQIQCPQEECNQIIDHYIIALFLDKTERQYWMPLSRDNFCPKKDCQNRIRLFPYQMVKTQIFKIDNDQSLCSGCLSHICHHCWTVFKGSYMEHQARCNSDNFRNQLLRDYMKEKEIFQCPKCQFYIEKKCPIQKYKRIEFCDICGTYICLFCKSADLQIFSQDSYNFEPRCNCFSNLMKKRFIQLVFIAILWILYLPIWIFLTAGKNFTKYLSLECYFLRLPGKRYLYYIFFPFILVFMILKGFFKYGKKFLERYLFKKFVKLIGVEEPIHFYFYD